MCRQWDVPANHTTVEFAGRDNVTHNIASGLHLRLEWLHYGGGDAKLQVLWRPGNPSSSAGEAKRATDFVPSPVRERKGRGKRVCVCVCVRACACVCVRACVFVCVCVCV